MDIESPLRISVVGCGFAARHIHLPRLAALPRLFQIVAVCDVVPQAADEASAQLGGVPNFNNFESMLHAIETDALAILTPLHAELLQTGLEHRLDIFVEKPFCASVNDAERLARVADEQEQVVMVGTMRVFDPALAYLVDLLPSIGPLRWVEVRDFCGQGMASATRSSLVDSHFQAAFPSARPRVRNALQTLLLEFVHDASILRKVFDTPIHCEEALVSDDGWSITGRLQLPNDVPCLFAVAEYGLVDAEIFEVGMSVAGERGRIHLHFEDPNKPGGTTTMLEHVGEVTKTFTSDPFKEEWLSFHQAVSERAVADNNAHAGAADVRLGWDILNKGLRE